MCARPGGEGGRSTHCVIHSKYIFFTVPFFWLQLLLQLQNTSSTVGGMITELPEGKVLDNAGNGAFLNGRHLSGR